jgi:hypothetical protein
MSLRLFLAIAFALHSAAAVAMWSTLQSGAKGGALFLSLMFVVALIGAKRNA